MPSNTKAKSRKNPADGRSARKNSQHNTGRPGNDEGVMSLTTFPDSEAVQNINKGGAKKQEPAPATQNRRKGGSNTWPKIATPSAKDPRLSEEPTPPLSPAQEMLKEIYSASARTITSESAPTARTTTSGSTPTARTTTSGSTSSAQKADKGEPKTPIRRNQRRFSHPGQYSERLPVRSKWFEVGEKNCKSTESRAVLGKIKNNELFKGCKIWATRSGELGCYQAVVRRGDSPPTNKILPESGANLNFDKPRDSDEMVSEIGRTLDEAICNCDYDIDDFIKQSTGTFQKLSHWLGGSS